MTTLDRYLEQSKIEELASQLKAEGFEIIAGPEVMAGRDSGYDLLARKGDQTIAYQVISQSNLRDSAKQIAVLREQARALGYADFRLVVVRPPARSRSRDRRPGGSLASLRD